MTCYDISARDLQKADGQWTRAKSFDSFCPLGPTVTTVDELGLADDINLQLDVNGEVKQRGSTCDLVFGVAELIAFCSRSTSLRPGDLIATGTPSGIGASRSPAEALRDGDTVTCRVEEIGVLRNPVVGAHFSHWGRDPAGLSGLRAACDLNRHSRQLQPAAALPSSREPAAGAAVPSDRIRLVGSAITPQRRDCC